MLHTPMWFLVGLRSTPSLTLETCYSIAEVGVINHQIIQRLLYSDLVVADLTDHNPNVFYELAVRHAAKKPFIQIIDENQGIPFDVASTSTVFFNHRDLDSAESAKIKVAEYAENFRSLDYYDSPMSQSVSLFELSKSENPADRKFSEFGELLSALFAQMSTLRKEMMSMKSEVPYWE